MLGLVLIILRGTLSLQQTGRRPTTSRPSCTVNFARAHFGTALFNNNIYEFGIFIFP